MKNKLISILFIILSAYCVFAQSDYDFAKFLYEEGDYFRAVTELKRVMFEDSLSDSSKIINIIGASYIMMGDYDNAESVLKGALKSNRDSEYNYLLTMFLMKKYECIDTFDASNEDAMVFKRLSLLFQNKLNEKDYPETANEEEAIIKDGYFSIERKNPLIGVLLSALVPGLGRGYAGRGDDGLFSFVTVITPLAASLYYKFYIKNDLMFYITAGITAVFYIGELYGAGNSSSIYHKSKTNEYYKKIIADGDYSIFIPKQSF